MSEPASIRVLIADDHKMLADALTMVVRAADGLEPVSDPVYSPDDAVSVCEQLTPDVAVIDLVYDGVIAGIDATAKIRKVSPATQVVVMTSHEDPRLLLESVQAGAAGFLKKNEAVDQVIDAIRGVAAGEVMIEAGVLASVMREAAIDGISRPQPVDLTARESEVFELLRSGLSNREIAERLFVTVTTVATHVHHILEKLGARSRLEAVVMANSLGDGSGW